MKFVPIAVATYQVAKGAIVSEVMGAGALKARVNATIGARFQEQLVEALADRHVGEKSPLP